MGAATGLPSLGNPGGVPDDVTGAGATGISSTGLGDTATTSSTLGGGLGGSSMGGGMYGGGMGGRGMYGGMGGMGMGGMGMMGGMGGMGMGGMYGGGMGMGMNGSDGPGFFMRTQMYLYQLCEIANMVAMNAEQLGGFYITMKKIGDYCFTSGKEWCLWII